MSGMAFHEKAGRCQQLFWLGKSIFDIFLCPDIRRFSGSDAVHNREDGGVRTKPESESQDGDCKSRRFAQAAQGVTQIAEQSFNRQCDIHLVRQLLRERSIAETPPRVALRCSRVHPRIDVSLSARFEMKLQLLKLVVHLVAVEQVQDSVKPAHGNLLLRHTQHTPVGDGDPIGVAGQVLQYQSDAIIAAISFASENLRCESLHLPSQYSTNRPCRWCLGKCSPESKTLGS
jgi:hypothetical protein